MRYWGMSTDVFLQYAQFLLGMVKLFTSKFQEDDNNLEIFHKVKWKPFAHYTLQETEKNWSGMAYFIHPQYPRY